MARRTRGRVDWIILAVSMIVFALVSFIANLEKGLAFGASAFVFGTIIQTKSETRKASLRERQFWMLIIALAVAHIVVLSLIHIPELKFGLVILPFALVDGFAMWWLIGWVEGRSQAASNLDLDNR